MTPITRREFHRLAAATALSATAGLTGRATAQKPLAPTHAGSNTPRLSDFAFLHLSDTHLNTRPEGQAFNPDGRSVGVIRWWADRAAQPIGRDGLPALADAADALPPAFALHTGDVFEYSVVDRCWDDWERLIADAGLPVHCVPGNHDNTWSSINHRLRAKYGNDSYSLDIGGCHVVCLNSAGSLDPLPCWDERTLRWLADDMAGVDRQTPVLLAMHHPQSEDAGFASEYDKLRLWEVIRGHRVVFMMDGHWHQVQTRVWQNIPSVNGGETYRHNPGYATVRVTDGVLRHRYHFHESARGGARRAEVLTHRIDRPTPRLQAELDATPVQRPSRIVRLRAIVSAEGTEAMNAPPIVEAWLGEDRSKAAAMNVAPSESRNGRPTWRATGELAIADDTPPGRQSVTLRMAAPGQQVAVDSEVGPEPTTVANEQGAEIELMDGDAEVVRRRHPAGIKSPLRVVDNTDGRALLVFGDTAGGVTAADRETLETVWTASTGSEVLHAVTVHGQHVIVGDGDGRVHRLDLSSGDVEGRIDGLAPVFGPAAVVGDRLYFGDGDGKLHGLDPETMSLDWSVDVAAYAVEAAPLHDPTTERLIVGAWDGRFHAVDRVTGDIAWSAWSTRGQVDRRSRYYGPADCPTVRLGRELWGTDRGYRLGRFALDDGSFLGEVAADVSAIAPVPPGSPTPGVLARTLNDELIRLDAQGNELWRTDVPLGRNPVPPLAVRIDSPDGPVDRVAAVSDTGLLTVLDADQGRTLHRHAATPGLFCLAPLAHDPEAHAWFVAGMDGVLTRYRPTQTT